MSGAEFTTNLLAQLTWALSGTIVLLLMFAADELWHTPFIGRMRKHLGFKHASRRVR